MRESEILREAEILIVGGGIAGASAALYLARHGRDVALVERGEIASEASGANAGAIGATGWGDTPNLESYLTMGSLQLFKEMQLDLGRDIEFRQSGSLTAIHDRAQYDYMRDRVDAMRSRGLVVELLTPREARAIEPELNPRLPAFMHSPLRAQADPVKATRAFADEAAKLGARIYTRHAVTGNRPSVRRRLLRIHERRLVQVRNAGNRRRRLVRPAGTHDRAGYPNQARARPDVGERKPAAQRLRHHVFRRILPSLER